MTPEDLEAMFTVPEPCDPEALGGQDIREGALRFAHIVLENTPPGATQTKAICSIVEAAMTARRARRGAANELNLVASTRPGDVSWMLRSSELVSIAIPLGEVSFSDLPAGPN